MEYVPPAFQPPYRVMLFAAAAVGGVALIGSIVTTDRKERKVARPDRPPR